MRGVVIGKRVLWVGLCSIVTVAGAGCGNGSSVLTPYRPPNASATPTPPAGASATPTAGSSATPTPAATASAKPTATPTASPTPSPSPAPSSAAHASIWGITANGNCASGSLNCIVEFPDAQLLAGNDAVQPAVIARNGYTMRAVAFDGSGNLWVSEQPTPPPNFAPLDGDVAEFSAAALNSTAPNTNVTPTLVVPINGDPQGIAFDPYGNFWVTVNSPTGTYEGNVEGFSGEPASASATPKITLSAASGQFGCYGIAFASDGTMWCSHLDSFGPVPAGLSGFMPSQIATSGSPAAAYMLSGPSGAAAESGQEGLDPYVRPVVFDPSGNLWSGDFGVVFEYAASSLHASESSPTRSFQAFTNTNPGGSVVSEFVPALAFDPSANLYASSVNSLGSQGLVIYSPSEYNSASPSPSVSIANSSSQPVPFFMTAGPADVLVRPQIRRAR